MAHWVDEPVAAAARFVLLALLVAAAWRDLAARTIPDAISVLLALLGLATRAAEGWLAPLLSLAVAAGLFLLLLPMAARGALGGGDVKLACAVVLGLSPVAAWDFVFATAMIGGVLGLAYLAGPALVPPRAAAPPRPGGGATVLRRLLAVEARRLRRRGPLPYAVAIAGGAALVLLTATSPGS